MEVGILFLRTPDSFRRLSPLQYVEEGKLRPEVVVSHRLPLSEAAHGYQIFNDKSDECLKVNKRFRPKGDGPAKPF